MLRLRPSGLVILLLTLLAVSALAFAACNDDKDKDKTPTDGSPSAAALGDVDVLGIWGGSELQSFDAMVAPWEADNGGEVDFVGTRGTAAQLTLNVEAGNPPDIALPAEIGLLQQFAADGLLTPLSECAGPGGEGTLEEYVRANYPQSFIDLGSVDGTLYGFFMKADGKGFIWYNPGFFTANSLQPLAADATYDDLITLSEGILATGTPPWTVGVESAADSGWAGTDWIQTILINNVEGGAEAAAGLVDGSVPWTDPRIVEAFDKFGQIVLTDGWTSQGGGDGVNATNFRDAIFPIVADPPGAGLHHQASFVTGEIAADFPDTVAGEDYDFFGWPGGAVFGAANVAYAFNNDEATCSLMAHLASAEAQQIWVDRGGFTSVNTQISVDSYGSDVASRAADRLLSADVFSFDIDDTLGDPVQHVFFTAITDYLADPSSLNASLAQIETVAEEARAG